MINNFSLDDDNCDDCNPRTIFHARLMAWYDRYKEEKASKKGRPRIVACSMVSNNRVGKVRVTRQKKK